MALTVALVRVEQSAWKDQWKRMAQCGGAGLQFKQWMVRLSVVLEGEERAVFEGDRISLLEDKVTGEEGQRLGAYMERPATS